MMTNSAMSRLLRKGMGIGCLVAVALSGEPAFGYVDGGRTRDVPPPVALVKYDFVNELQETSASVQAAVTIYSGNVGPYRAPGSGATTPTLPIGTSPVYGQVTLVESGIGAPLSRDVPYGSFAADSIKRAQDLLYWSDSNSPAENDKAAFRYLVKLYGPDTGASSRLASSENGAVADEARAEMESKGKVRDAALSSLEQLAATPIPSVEEMVARVPGGEELSSEELEGLEHRRQIMVQRVAYANRTLQEIQSAETRLQSGRSSLDTSIRCNFENISQFYSDPERARIEQALTILRQALRYAPLNRTLSNVYLDVFYDKAVAELQFIKIAKVERAKYRLGLKQLPPSKQFVIDEEIDILENEVLPKYKSSLTGLSTLLQDRGGVNVNELDSSFSPNTPLGYYLFKREQPLRNKMAARWVDSGGNVFTVPRFDPLTSTTTTNGRIIFDGYKDYVMVLSILSDYLVDAADLARLYGMRNQETDTVNDREKALEIVREMQQATAVDVKLLEQMFADYDPQPTDASGVYGARQGIQSGLGEMEGVRNFLTGTSNALGFDPNFLVLIKEFPDSTQGNQFDSYDALVRWIRNTDTSVYNFAKTTYQVALARYDQYRATADSLYSQTGEIDQQFMDRYFEIVGTIDPDDPNMTVKNPGPGSELAQVLQDLETLKKKSGLMDDLSDTLNEAISESTVYKEVSVPGKESAVNNMLTTYKNSVSSEFDTITHWSAAAVGAQAAYDTINNTANIMASSSQTPWSAGAGAAAATIVGVAGVANMCIQISAAEMQGAAEKNIDSAQATLNASLALKDSVTDKHDAAQELLSLRREKVGNAIESTGLQGELAQAYAQYTGLLREVDRIMQQRKLYTSELSDRYYSDPIHQLRAESSQLRADGAFRDAQRWVFFTQRALEYKWNKPFALRVGNKNFDSGTIMKVRNFEELEDLMVAVEQFNTYNLIGFNREPFVDKLSLKYDFFGYRDDAQYAVTNANGTSVTVDANEAFRRRMIQLVDEKTGVLEIPMDTFALAKQDGVFFSGPEYNNSGEIFSAGKYLDKIEWMKFNIISSEKPKVLTAAYSYGGTSYIRTRVPPCLNMGDDRSLPGEFNRFPFRYFLTLDNGASWIQRPTQDDTVKVVMSNVSGEPLDSAENPLFRNTFLKERSVAATQQKLRIMASKVDLSKMKDVEIYVRHMFVSRDLPACN